MAKKTFNCGCAISKAPALFCAPRAGLNTSPLFLGFRAARGYDCAATIFLAFIPPFKMFATPKIAVTDNETGDRLRKCRN